MTITKSTIVTALRDRGQHLRADWVDRDLPDRVDVTRHVGLLATLDLDPAVLQAEERQPTEPTPDAPPHD